MVQAEDLFGLLEQRICPAAVRGASELAPQAAADTGILARARSDAGLAAAVCVARGVLAAPSGAAVAVPLSIPRATYRVQLNSGFGFEDATAIVPYLARLGVSTRIALRT